MSDAIEAFPLFPLDLVALPTELVPLHVFEERYRVMFERLLAQDGAFAIVRATDGGLESTGCACRIEEVLQRYDDGRLDVVCRGTTPLRIVGERADVPFPAAAVELLADEDEAVDPDAREAARSAYAMVVETVTGEPPDPQPPADRGAYEIAAGVELPPEAKQGLLELRSENARLRLLAELLTDALAGLQRADLDRARARSNGKLRF